MAKQMSKTQIDHLNERLDMAIRAATRKFKESLPAVPKSVELSYAERKKAIKAGKYTLAFDSDGTLPYYSKDAVVFEAEQKSKEARKKVYDENDAACNKFSAPLYAEKQVIMDAAILGGAEEALASMQAFITKLSV